MSSRNPSIAPSSLDYSSSPEMSESDMLDSDITYSDMSSSEEEEQEQEEEEEESSPSDAPPNPRPRPKDPLARKLSFSKALNPPPPPRRALDLVVRRHPVSGEKTFDFIPAPPCLEHLDTSTHFYIVACTCLQPPQRPIPMVTQATDFDNPDRSGERDRVKELKYVLQLWEAAFWNFHWEVYGRPATFYELRDARNADMQRRLLERELRNIGVRRYIHGPLPPQEEEVPRENEDQTEEGEEEEENLYEYEYEADGEMKMVERRMQSMRLSGVQRTTRKTRA